MYPFHLAMPVTDIANTIEFYTKHFGCTVGRKTEHWVDLNFYGHQISFHRGDLPQNTINSVDVDAILLPHFGVIIDKDQWQQLHSKLQRHAMKFLLDPKIRFSGQAGEQGTFLFKTLLEIHWNLNILIVHHQFLRPRKSHDNCRFP